MNESLAQEGEEGGWMDATPHESLVWLLRSYRRNTTMTQEELAERAGVSADTSSAIERRPPHLPRKETPQPLVEALGPRRKRERTSLPPGVARISSRGRWYANTLRSRPR